MKFIYNFFFPSCFFVHLERKLVSCLRPISFITVKPPSATRTLLFIWNISRMKRIVRPMEAKARKGRWSNSKQYKWKLMCLKFSYPCIYSLFSLDWNEGTRRTERERISISKDNWCAYKWFGVWASDLFYSIRLEVSTTEFGFHFLFVAYLTFETRIENIHQCNTLLRSLMPIPSARL